MHREPLRHFLLIFDHGRGELVRDPRAFDDVNEAMRAYEAAEVKYDLQSAIEVVPIGSDSLETVRMTHANYFDGTAALARALAKVLKLQTPSG